MFGVFSQSLARFRRDERGVVLIIFILVVVPLLLVIAVGIDFSQTLVVKRQLTSAIDSAALALGRLPDLTEQTDLDAKAEAFIRSHYPENAIGDLTAFNVVKTPTNDGGFQIDISATAVVQTTLMQIGGVDSLTVSVDSSVIYRENELEVIMVLDNSGSMGNGGKLQAMKDAANLLVDILFQGDDTSDKVRIGLVPFTAGVNVNVPETTPWLDIGNPAPLNNQYINDFAAGEGLFTVLQSMSGGIASRWGRCVRSRFNAGVDTLDTTDTPPDPLAPETLFSAYFNHFASNTRPHSKTLYAGLSSNQQNADCPVAPVQPLTNVKSTITTAVNAMTASGNTNIPEALAWGWRLVSADEPFTEGAPYTDQRVIKAIILLSDGENQVSGANTYSSYGYGGTDNPQVGPTVNASLNSRTTIVCNNIKQDKDGVTDDDDILVFTIVFNVNSGTIITLMQNCATDLTKYFNSPSAAALQAAFQAIASSLSQLRIAE